MLNIIQFLNFLIWLLKRKKLKEAKVHDFLVYMTWGISPKSKML